MKVQEKTVRIPKMFLDMLSGSRDIREHQKFFFVISSEFQPLRGEGVHENPLTDH